MPDRAWLLLVLACCTLAACASPTLSPDAAIQCNSCASWNEPQSPFRIFGNTYYVGTAGLSSILIATKDGLVLFDGGLPQSARLIADNVHTLGFDPRDIRVIAVSHAHFDHVGGIAALQRLSDADVVTSLASLWVMRRGVLPDDDPQFDPDNRTTEFPAIPGSDALDDGAVFTIGGVSVRGIYTPGHTPGGMTWTWQSCEDRRCLDFVYADSISPVSVDGYRFSDGLGAALGDSIERIGNLECDIFLAPHPFLFGLKDKIRQGPEAFIDKDACSRYAASSRAGLERRLGEEHGAAP